MDSQPNAVPDLPRVLLAGDALDLENLRLLLGEGPHRVRVADDQYWLHSSEFAALVQDPDTLWSKATALLQLITGSVRVKFPDLGKVEVGTCIDYLHPDGRRRRRLREVVSLHVRSARRVDPQATKEPVSDNVTLGLADSRVREVLRLMALPVSWGNLYKIYELVRADAGSRIANWATRTELSRFTHTAQSPTALGDEARHAVERSTPPLAPMKLDDAATLIRQIMDGWLAEKRNASSGN